MPGFVDVEKVAPAEQDLKQSRIHKELLRQQRNLRLNLISERDFALIRESLYNQSDLQRAGAGGASESSRSYKTAKKTKYS